MVECLMLMSNLITLADKPQIPIAVSAPDERQPKIEDL
jgi:hypothetical protein